MSSAALRLSSPLSRVKARKRASAPHMEHIHARHMAPAGAACTGWGWGRGPRATAAQKMAAPMHHPAGIETHKPAKKPLAMLLAWPIPPSCEDNAALQADPEGRGTIAAGCLERTRPRQPSLVLKPRSARREPMHQQAMIVVIRIAQLPRLLCQLPADLKGTASVIRQLDRYSSVRLEGEAKLACGRTVPH